MPVCPRAVAKEQMTVLLPNHSLLLVRGCLPSRQKSVFEICSWPLRLPKARQMLISTLLEMNLTLPSQNNEWTPPGGRLRAVTSSDNLSHQTLVGCLCGGPPRQATK